jgi:hypothetical protein
MYAILLVGGRDTCPAYSTIRNLVLGEDIDEHASGGGPLPDDRVDGLVANTLEESPFHIFLTGDESWFDFKKNYDHAWIREGAVIPTRLRQTISNPNRMLTVFWSPFSFSLVRMLRKGAHFDVHYFCTAILADVDRIRLAATAEDARRNVVVHFHNASPPTATVNFVSSHRMKRAVQPPFSRELAPSDFDLFGRLKTELNGAELEDERELLDGVMRVLNGITRDEPGQIIKYGHPGHVEKTRLLTSLQDTAQEGSFWLGNNMLGRGKMLGQSGRGWIGRELFQDC